MTVDHGGDTRIKLAQRLRAISPLLLTGAPDVVADPAEDAARLLAALAEGLADKPSNSRVWLLLSAISAAYPTRDEVDQARRQLELTDPAEAAILLLDLSLSSIQASGSPTAEIEILTGQVIVDVDFTARHNLHTGIQRVVRQTVPLWNLEHDITPAAWTNRRGALRPLSPVESARIYQWSGNPSLHPRPEEDVAGTDHRIMIPWRSVLVLPEVPTLDVTPLIAAIGACSNNRIVAIGHDAIPLISADTLDMEEPRKFMSYLSALKFSSHIAGVSRSSAREFASYGTMLSSQGLPSPRTTAIPLPVEFGESSESHSPLRPAQSDGSDIVVVGSHDTRKNHLAVLHAAEILWQEGLEFRLIFIGGGGSNLEFQRRIEVLRYRHRTVELRTAVTDEELQAAVSASRFTIFPSLHEGYGLPVAESLALGTPVITTNYGATAEIASGGGAVTVNPRNDRALADAMRHLLTDDSEIARLHTEITRRAERSWQVYADELWNTVVGPVLEDAARAPVDEGR